MLVRLNGGNATAKNLATMEQILKKYDSVYPFEYTTRLPTKNMQKFADEQLTGTLRFTLCDAGDLYFMSWVVWPFNLYGRKPY